MKTNIQIAQNEKKYFKAIFLSAYLENLEVSPLLAKIDADVRASYGQVSSGMVEAQVFDLVVLVQLDGLEVLQLAQIPELNTRVLSSCRGQIVTVLRESNGRNRTGVPLKVGDVALLQKKRHDDGNRKTMGEPLVTGYTYFFQIPNFNHCVRSACSQDETVRVKLGRGQGCCTFAASSVSDLSDQLPGANVGERPMLILQ